MTKGLRVRRDHVIEAMVKGLGARVIEIEAGTHTISLAPPTDFKPKKIKVVLEADQTGPLSPKEVTFETV